MPRARVFVAGTGCVGLGLALALSRAGVPLVGAWNRGAVRARAARRILGRAVATGPFPETLAEADIVLVCVNDGAVHTVSAALARSGLLHRGAVVAHVSGALASTELAAVRGVARGSLHPIVACVDPRQAAARFAGATFAIEGDRAARRTLATLVRSLGGRAVTIPRARKARYHAALALASNLVVALLELAGREAEAAGLGDRRALAELTLGAVELARERGPTAALTGPIVRGDVETVAGHLSALGRAALPAYRELSRVAVELARRRGLPRKRALELERLLAFRG